MRWTQAFDEAMGELREARKQLERLDDPTVGLPALHGELSQARMKIQEVVQNGVTGLREENRELRRRQDKMISDLQESREETREQIHQLRELADLLRGFAIAPAAAPQPYPPHTGAVEASQNGDEDITERPKWQTVRAREDQGENMEHTEGQDPRQATGSEGAEDGLKHAIEARLPRRGHRGRTCARCFQRDARVPGRGPEGCTRRPAAEGRRRRLCRTRPAPRHLGIPLRFWPSTTATSVPRPPSRTSRRAASRPLSPGARSLLC